MRSCAKVLAASSVALTACGGAPSASTPPPQVRPLEIATTRELGPLGHPASVTVRDGGASALLDGRILWTFGDTLLATPAADGSRLRSNTAGRSDPASPLVLTEPLDARGAPSAFLAFAPDEQAYNESTNRGDMRIALWPGSVVASDSGGLVFYLKLYVNPGLLNYDFVGVGVASVAANASAAVRDGDLLFRAPEPSFDNAAVLDGQLYVYGNIQDGTHDQAVGVARASLPRLRERAAYTFWDGSAWVADVRRTARVLTGVPGAVSVSYNAYLGAYLAVHSVPFSQTVAMHVSSRPEGPWGPPVAAFSGLAPAAGSYDYAGREHPHMAADVGRTVYVSYFQPLGGFRGDLRLVEVRFR